MKLQFKQQDFQIAAVNAVVRCFEGQPLWTNHFTLERTSEILKKSRNQIVGHTISMDFEVEELIGYRNSPLKISKEQIFKNIIEVQREQYLIENQELDHVKGADIGYNFTIEMETGTGKTYT